ncbi:MAG: RIP metalloprotease RseP, partial [Deltaproteobacteria bacterium]|nr:RIP metalloprotease RseP [Deltaproteobacteria bacterium]
MVWFVVSFVVVLGFLIFVHELGHFILAKLMGVGVKKFSLGFGPKIVSKKVGMTEYDASDLPLSYSHKSVGKRALIILAGPLFNMLLAVVIFFSLFQFSGLPIMEPEVGELQEGMAAQASGILPGDRVVSINGKPVGRWSDMAAKITESDGRSLGFEILRDDRTFLVEITPQLVPSQNIWGEEVEKYAIGITASGTSSILRLNVFQSATESLTHTWEIAALTTVAIGKIITGSISAKALGGPIFIAQLTGEQAKAGLVSLLFFVAVLSINLGIINLLPIPILDGGHLFFCFIEAVSRRPVNLKVREVAQQVGFFVLVILMLFVIYNDISRV